MRITIQRNREEILQVICNCCGKQLPVENGIVLEDYLHVEKQWGFFSGRDGEITAFDLCEACTEALMERFAVPAHQKSAEELL